MTRRHISDDALSRELAALPQPALPRDFAPVVLAQIARTPAARPRRAVRSGRAWAPWAIGIGALVALGLSAEVSPPLMGRVSGLALLRLPWTVHVCLALAVGVYVLGLVATLRPKARASI
jgi:hypothetical protein